MPRLRRSNCLAFALAAWLRLRGYVLIRRSHVFRWIPHVLWTDKHRRHLVSFKPDDPEERPGRSQFRWLWFAGRMRWGDSHDPPPG